MADLIKSKFLEAYYVLKSELLHDPSFEFTNDSRQWVERVRALVLVILSNTIFSSFTMANVTKY